MHLIKAGFGQLGETQLGPLLQSCQHTMHPLIVANLAGAIMKHKLSGMPDSRANVSAPHKGFSEG
jgi:hypothetical protein